MTHDDPGASTSEVASNMPADIKQVSVDYRETIWCQIPEEPGEGEHGPDSAAGEGQVSTNGGLEHAHNSDFDLPGVRIGACMSSHRSPTQFDIPPILGNTRGLGWLEQHAIHVRHAGGPAKRGTKRLSHILFCLRVHLNLGALLGHYGACLVQSHVVITPVHHDRERAETLQKLALVSKPDHLFSRCDSCLLFHLRSEQLSSVRERRGNRSGSFVRRPFFTSAPSVS